MGGMQGIKRTEAVGVGVWDSYMTILAVYAGYRVVVVFVHGARRTVRRTFCTVTAPSSAPKKPQTQKTLKQKLRALQT